MNVCMLLYIIALLLDTYYSRYYYIYITPMYFFELRFCSSAAVVCPYNSWLAIGTQMQVLSNVIYIYIYIHLDILFTHCTRAVPIYNIYCNMLEEDFSRRRIRLLYMLSYIIVISCFTARLVSYVGIVQISIRFEIAHFRKHPPPPWL